MVEQLYAQGDGLFRGSLSKSIYTNYHLKLDRGPQMVLVLEPNICLTGT